MQSSWTSWQPVHAYVLVRLPVPVLDMDNLCNVVKHP